LCDVWIGTETMLGKEYRLGARPGSLSREVQHTADRGRRWVQPKEGTSSKPTRKVFACFKSVLNPWGREGVCELGKGRGAERVERRRRPWLGTRLGVLRKRNCPLNAKQGERMVRNRPKKKILYKRKAEGGQRRRGGPAGEGGTVIAFDAVGKGETKSCKKSHH